MITESFTTAVVTSKENQPQKFTEASYYLMKNGFILRLEQALDPENVPLLIRANFLDPKEIQILSQDQANYRVAIFRDEILEMPEYQKRVFGIVQ